MLLCWLFLNLFFKKVLVKLVLKVLMYLVSLPFFCPDLICFPLVLLMSRPGVFKAPLSPRSLPGCHVLPLFLPVLLICCLAWHLVWALACEHPLKLWSIGWLRSLVCWPVSRKWLTLMVNGLPSSLGVNRDWLKSRVVGGFKWNLNTEPRAAEAV